MLRGQAMFMYEGGLAPGAGALPPHILCFSAPFFIHQKKQHARNPH